MTNLFPTEHPPAVIDQFDVEVRPSEYMNCYMREFTLTQNAWLATGKTKKPAPPVASKAAKKTTKPSSTKAKNPKPRPSLVADSASEASSSAESTDSSEESEADDEEDDEDAVASAAREVCCRDVHFLIHADLNHKQPRIFGKAGSPGTRVTIQYSMLNPTLPDHTYVQLPPVAEKRFKPRVEHGESDSEVRRSYTVSVPMLILPH